MKWPKINNKYLKGVLAAGMGGGIGLGYYLLIGCSTGGCPITSNPYLISGVGIVMGLSFVKWK